MKSVCQLGVIAFLTIAQCASPQPKVIAGEKDVSKVQHLEQSKVGRIRIKSEFVDKTMKVALGFINIADGKSVPICSTPTDVEHSGLATVIVGTIKPGETKLFEVPPDDHDISVSDDICWGSPKRRVNVPSGKTISLVCGTTLTKWQFRQAFLRQLLSKRYYRENMNKLIYLRPESVDND
jgi:hypothetical protein